MSEDEWGFKSRADRFKTARTGERAREPWVAFMLDNLPLSLAADAHFFFALAHNRTWRATLGLD